MSEGERNKEELDDSKTELDRLVEILTKPEKRILPLLYSTGTSNPNEDGEDSDGNKESDRDKNRTLMELLDISKHLFADIESLGKQYQQLHEKAKTSSRPDKDEQKMDLTTTPVSSMILSGLLKLHVPPGVEPTDTDLPETIFGQVDLQTAALAKLVKKSTKRLVKADSDGICVLDMGVVDSDGGDDDDSNEQDASDDESDDQNMDEGDIDSDDDDDAAEDEEEKRIRLRMERAMEDMGEEDIESSDAEDENTKDGGNKKRVNQNDNKELFDPVAEDMKDGFFDLNEMEDFADEEEDYLPSEAFGQPSDEKSKNKKQLANKKSFHQRQREGIDNEHSDSEDSDERELDEMYEEVKDVKRKKYREKEDIDALYEIYQETNPDDSDDDDDDIVNMTAADYFGGPKKKYIEQYQKKHPVTKKSTGPKDNDDDSWGEYDFEKENQEGWQDNDGGDDDDDDADDDDDEMEDMKDPSTSGQHKDDVEIATRKTDDKKLTKQEEKLQRQTDELERELVNEKPWQMKGESKSTSRPVNSLLEGTPEFEMASKQAPIITVEHTIDLEEAIKQRILAEDWDDVVPRELPDISWNKKRGEAPEVSQEKSKLGLGELYEREYLKKAVGFDKDAFEKQTEEDKAKDEMKQLFANLCSKLDALSNYHFAPRPIADEAEARSVTVPAIAMEEVLPLHVSDARGVAPEEVFATKRGREGILRADAEMDQTDRKRQRQTKKSARRKVRKEKEADEKLISRLQPGLGLNNPYEKRKAREELSLARARGKVTEGEKEMDTKYGSSGTFFKRLQDEAQQTVKDHASANSGNDHEKKSKPRSSAFKL
jgi:U3 small nucleolar RNA-associated protein MPP10